MHCICTTLRRCLYKKFLPKLSKFPKGSSPNYSWFDLDRAFDGTRSRDRKDAKVTRFFVQGLCQDSASTCTTSTWSWQQSIEVSAFGSAKLSPPPPPPPPEQEEQAVLLLYCIHVNYVSMHHSAERFTDTKNFHPLLSMTTGGDDLINIVATVAAVQLIREHYTKLSCTPSITVVLLSFQSFSLC